MKKTFVRRITALLLSLVMTAGMLPLLSGNVARAEDFGLSVQNGILTISGDASDTNAFRAGLSSLNWNEITTIKTAPGTKFPEQNAGLFAGKSTIRSVDFSGADFSQTTSITALFVGCSNLQSVIMRDLDFSNITSADQIFAGCQSLETVDFSGSDFASVETFTSLFANCSALTTVTGLSSSSTNLTNARSMFTQCYRLSSIDLSGITATAPLLMDYMFMNCTSLTDVSFSPDKTYKASSLNGMFSGCSSLQTVDLSSIDTSDVTDMGNMFYACFALKSLDLSTFSTANVLNFSYMFYECRQLRELDLSTFMPETDKPSVSYMFHGCANLTELDLSGLDITACPVNSTAKMFAYMSHLKKLTLGTGFPKITDTMELAHPEFGWVNSAAPNVVVSQKSSDYNPMTLLTNSGKNTYLSNGGYAEIIGTELSLLEDGTFGLRFYASLSPNMDPEDLAKGDVWFFFYPQSYTSIQVRAEKDSAGNYFATCYLPAKEMNNTIQADLYFYSRRVRDLEPGEEAPVDYWSQCFDTVKYSIRNYADDILSDPVQYASAQNIVKAMLCLGGAAQRFFGNYDYTLSKPCADVGITYTGPQLVHQAVFEAPSPLPELSYYGTSLILGSVTTERHYFLLTDGAITDYVFTADGLPVTPTASEEYDGLYYIETVGVSALNLSTPITIKVETAADPSASIQFRYSAMEYIRLGLAGGQLKGASADLALALGHLAMEALSYANQ